MGNTVAKGLEAWDSEEGSRLSWKPGGKSGGRVDRCDGGSSSDGHPFTEQFPTSDDNKRQHLLGAHSAPDSDLSNP